MKTKPVRLLIGMLCLCLAFSGVSALGEETASLQATVEPDESAVTTDAQADQVLEDPGALSGNADAVGDADISTALYVATATAPLTGSSRQYRQEIKVPGGRSGQSSWLVRCNAETGDSRSRAALRNKVRTATIDNTSLTPSAA